MTDTLFVFIMDLPTFAFFYHPQRSEGGLPGMENGHAVLILGGMSLAPSSSLLSSRSLYSPGRDPPNAAAAAYGKTKGTPLPSYERLALSYTSVVLYNPGGGSGSSWIR